MKIHYLKNDAEINTILQKQKYSIYLLQLSAKWCPPCVRITPDVQKYVKTINNENALYIYCDVDKCPNLYQYVNVQGIPAFVSIVKNTEGLYDVEKMTSSSLSDIERFCTHVGIDVKQHTSTTSK